MILSNYIYLYTKEFTKKKCSFYAEKLRPRVKGGLNNRNDLHTKHLLPTTTLLSKTALNKQIASTFFWTPKDGGYRVIKQHLPTNKIHR